jgi:hypothetical protein
MTYTYTLSRKNVWVRHSPNNVIILPYVQVKTKAIENHTEMLGGSEQSTHDEITEVIQLEAATAFTRSWVDDTYSTKMFTKTPPKKNILETATNSDKAEPKGDDAEGMEMVIPNIVNTENKNKMKLKIMIPKVGDEELTIKPEDFSVYLFQNEIIRQQAEAVEDSVLVENTLNNSVPSVLQKHTSLMNPILHEYKQINSTSLDGTGFKPRKFIPVSVETFKLSPESRGQGSSQTIQTPVPLKSNPVQDGSPDPTGLSPEDEERTTWKQRIGWFFWRILQRQFCIHVELDNDDPVYTISEI